MAPPAGQPPSLQEALARSTAAWQDHLQALFSHAKDWFPDVVWELQDEDHPNAPVEEVWGHKAVVYARAPPSFQARYFSFRPPPIASPMPYASSPTPGQSALSLSLGPDFPSRSPSPSPFRVPSPSPSSMPGQPLRIPTFINPTLFSNELEYLYTGKGLGDAFEFLFDTSETRAEEDGGAGRVDKLRKDLVFMWRSRLYSDIRIALEGSFSSHNHETAVAIFASHRFILVSRSPYFHTQLLKWPSTPPPQGEPLTVTLPSPPFTPASLHFTLGYMYTGTLAFSHRTYDLDTAFAILRASIYLELVSLHDEVQARIVQEMLHGLYHAFLEFSEYESVTGGRWGAGGCRCRQCARRAPRVLEFAVAEDVKNPHLERGARRALVGLFGEGWCNPDFAGLPEKTRGGLLKGVAKRTTPQNVFALLRASQHALEKLQGNIDAWADVSREMVLNARKTIERVLCDQAEECFEQPDWLEIVEEDGQRFEDSESVTLIMDAVKKGLADKNAPMVYQVLVSSILLRPHATEVGQTALSSTSPVRVQVEQTRVEVLRWLRRKWVNVRQENGFEPLEDWALKEISHEIDVPVEELIAPVPGPAKGATNRNTLRVTNRDETDTASMHSMRSAASRSVHRAQGDRESVMSSASSVRSVARSMHSAVSRASTAKTTNTNAARRKPTAPPHDPRPDSKLSPSSSSIASSIRTSVATADTSPRSRGSAAGPRASLTVATNNPRAPSKAASVTSVRSRASTVRKSSAPDANPSLLSPAAAGERPDSTVSATSTEFKSANSGSSSPADDAPRPRRLSTASSVSTSSAVTSPSIKSPRVSKAAPSSTTRSSRQSTSRDSLSSLPSSVRSRRVTPTSTESSRNTNMTRSVSSASTRSSVSTRSVSSTSPSVARRSTPRASVDSKAAKGSPTASRASTVSKASSKSTAGTKASQAGQSGTPKGKQKGKAVEEDDSENRSRASTETIVTSKLKRKSSADTIRESPVVKKSTASLIDAAAGSATSAPPTVPPVLQLSDTNGQLAPLGATLEIGIPCIISSKRAKFRALARYIGEIAGERGPWVGVEVPVGEGWAADRLEGRQWHDGTWGGIRYFDLGSGSDLDMGDTRARRTPGGFSGSMFGKGLKREGDTLGFDRSKRFRSESPAVSDVSVTESRGLFVRPQQVLYVVDAVGDF